MTVPTTIDAGAWLGKHLEGEDGDADLARAMLPMAGQPSPPDGRLAVSSALRALSMRPLCRVGESNQDG